MVASLGVALQPAVIVEPCLLEETVAVFSDNVRPMAAVVACFRLLGEPVIRLY